LAQEVPSREERTKAIQRRETDDREPAQKK
jgi:hypothetical protein